MPPPSSLVFVVIVAIWAAYLVQHWVRRRDTVATERPAYGATGPMRVLRRQPSGTSGPEETASPAEEPSPRIDAPGVDPRQGPPAADGHRSPLVARSSTDPVQDSREVDNMAPYEQLEHSRSAPKIPPAQRRLRAGMLVAALVWIPASVVLVLLDRLVWISIPFSLLTLVAVVVWLRTEATADRARARVRRLRETASHSPASDETQVIRADIAALAGRPRPAPSHRTAEPSGREAVADPVAPPAPGYEAGAPELREEAVIDRRPQQSGDEVYDGQAISGPVPLRPPPAVRPEPTTDGTWHPMPVPPPTYAWKAKAEPRMTPDGIPADVFDTPEFADEADELDERARIARRAASE